MQPLLRHAARASVVSLILASTTLLGTPAQALPVYTEGGMNANSVASSSVGSCVIASTQAPPVFDVPVVENGPATSVSASQYGTITYNNDNSDTLDFATQTTVTGKMTSTGGHPDTLDLAATGSVTATASKPVSTCDLTGYSSGDLDFQFTLTQGGFLDITLDASKLTYSEFYLFDFTDGDVFVDLYGKNLQFSGTQRVYLPPGVYGGYLGSRANISWIESTLNPTAVSTKIHADFDVAGSQTAAPVGKASKFVTLPGARSCASDSLDAKITNRKNRANKIKKVKFYVNGKLAAKKRKPSKGTVVKVSVADKVQADLKAVVTTVRKKNGKPGKTYEVKASYEACS